MEEPSENCRKLNSSLKLYSHSPSPPKMLRVRHMSFSILLIVFIFIRPPSSTVEGQPFLNSLAVLFRARPPWPTTFPSSKYTAIPSPLLSAAGSHQGILVAHPINPSNGPNSEGTQTIANYNTNSNTNSNSNSNSNSNNDKNKKPDTVTGDTAQSHSQQQQQPPAPSSQQNFIPLPSAPTISPPIPVFPPPIQMFHNRHNVLGPGHNLLVHHNAPPPPPPPGQLHKLHKINPNQVPILLSSPTSLVGSIAFPDPPTTVSNPHYGMLLENIHKHHKKHKHGYRANVWNPLWITGNASNNNNTVSLSTSSSTNPHHGHTTNQNNQQQQTNQNTNTNLHHEAMMKENSRRQKKLKDFRPSPQLNSFIETEYEQGKAMGSSDLNKDKEMMAESEKTPLSHYPRFESGFRPISFNQYAAQFGTTATRPHYTNSQQQYFNPWSIAFDPNNPQNYNQQHQNQYQQGNGRDGSREGGNPGDKPFRQDRQIVTGAMSQSVVTTETDVSIEEGSTEEEEERGEDGEFVFIGNREKKKSSERDNKGKSRHRFSSKGKKHRPIAATTSSTTASSELVEEWLPPNLRIQKKSDGRRKYPTFAKKNHKNMPKSSSKETMTGGGPKGMMKLPDKCDKFHKFGFCPVTRQYPLEAAEKIASRCSALLSHLIAPLPKMDVQYDIAVEGGKQNGSVKGRSTGWSWKSYQGKPVCDTDELTTVPGWAKNEYGDWMIILQTKLWQQKAHISLCSPSATHCQGLICNKKSDGSKTSKEKLGDIHTYTKCVQRFTAQRLAVFDPDNPDFCPVVRSVFLPSACVCLTSTAGLSSSSASSSIEETQASSLNSQFTGRQPLFSSNSNEEEVHGNGSEKDTKKKKNSKEILTLDKSHNSKNNSRGISTGRLARVVGPVYIYSQGGITTRESRKSHQDASNSFENSSSPLTNGTFMIITEKFTTNESSKETTDVVQVSSSSTPTKTDNGTEGDGGGEVSTHVSNSSS